MYIYIYIYTHTLHIVAFCITLCCYYTVQHYDLIIAEGEHDPAGRPPGRRREGSEGEMIRLETLIELYVYIYIYTHTYAYAYIYIYRERERESEISQFELFELILLSKLDERLPVERFEATLSQSALPSPPLNRLSGCKG